MQGCWGRSNITSQPNYPNISLTVCEYLNDDHQPAVETSRVNIEPLESLQRRGNKPGTLGQASNGIQEHYADRSVSILVIK